mmetsp:Transcript_30705/g.22787  ORF Transcript_30705/g.22787 Transcript_30705/m.22787 type:complete len:133 (-) Transcript_30705:1192-1590(-)
MGLQVNMVGETLRYFNLSQFVRTLSLDVNFNAFPSPIPFLLSAPLLYFFPAGKKELPPVQFKERMIAGTILKFLEKHSGLGVEFPMEVATFGMPIEEAERVEKQMKEEMEREAQKRKEEEEFLKKMMEREPY